jgi:Tfp pilus assembly protein PilZ
MSSRLKLHLVERGDFAKFYDPNTPGGGLFVASADPPPIGTQRTVEVVFQGGPRVLLHGKVLWRRATGDQRARPGVGIGFDPTEQAKLSYIQGYVRGGLLDVRRKSRLPVRLRVAYVGPSGHRRINFTRDINDEGAFVRTAELPEIGAVTLLLLSPPGEGYKPIEVRATVARLQNDGFDRGVGVRFEFATPDERQRFETFMKKLESDYLDGTLPDAALL